MLSKEDARELVRRLRATDGKGQSGPLKKAAADYIEELEAEIREMVEVAEIAASDTMVDAAMSEAIAQERERCARVAEEARIDPAMIAEFHDCGEYIAAKIREGS